MDNRKYRLISGYITVLVVVFIFPVSAFAAIKTWDGVTLIFLE